MTFDKTLIPPEASVGDTGHLVLSTILSTIPGAAELFQYFVTPPLEKRRNKWMKNIGQALQELEQKQEGLLANLQSDELFITILMQASNVAVRNHQQKKLRALRNAVLNSALQIKIEEDLKLLFVRYIDELTVSHFTLLEFFLRNEQAFEKTETYEELYQQFLIQYSQEIERDEFKLLCQDLMGRNLVRISSNVTDFSGISESILIATAASTSGSRLKVTNVSKKLLSFVSDEGIAPSE